jgi:hypothetical protein
VIDFGAILGSDSDMIKNARFGNEYIIPEPKPALKEMVLFGLRPKPWETARMPRIQGAGRFQADTFDPEKWVSNFPNRAFVHRLPDDEYWAAKQVMAFNDAEIRTIVETGKFSDPRAVDSLTKTLIERRNRIGRAYFTKVLAVDNFAVRNGRLEFSDLAAESGFVPRREFQIAWQRVDNASGAMSPIAGASGPALPTGLQAGEYAAAMIHQAAEPAKKVTVFVRYRGAGSEVAGIERAW